MVLATYIAKVCERVAHGAGSVSFIPPQSTFVGDIGCFAATRHHVIIHSDIGGHINLRHAVCKELQVETVHIGRDTSIAESVVVE